MQNLIESNPKIMLGKPVIKGTRITVELILEKLAAGETVDEILNEYSHLKREAVSSVLHFALENLRKDFPPRSENQKLFEAINQAYADEPTEEERRELRLMKNKTFKVLDEWK